MALVDDDEIKEIGWVGFKQGHTTLVLSERLVDGKIHLAAFNRFAGFDLVPSITESSEDAVLRLVNEDVAVGQIKNARPAVFPGPIPPRRP
jgi:hypothetical protein